MNTKNDQKILKKLSDAKEKFFNEIEKTIVGQKDVLDHILISLLCKGHILLIGVPGLAKTLMIKSLSELLDLDFNRIQFTPDLMPSDITGTEIIEQNRTTGKRSFKFFKGPVFSNILLADEINRTPPKTQSALLEAMQEHKITNAGKVYDLDQPFFVLATQNPIEQEGTYPLPEAQLDRFMFNILVNYPSRDEEVSIVNSTTSNPKADLKKIMAKKEILEFQSLIPRVPIAENVVEYAVDLVNSTRPGKNATSFVNNWIEWGAGPRASQHLVIGAKAKALLNGKSSPSISDIKALALPILRHRIIPNFNADAEAMKVDDIIKEILK
ncbi:MAG: AAA family ATPase [Candidatus Marinimicrobia bacterium]|nr:AAA family ATPase [Candidatus Neomarinimicrobiota bacterium]